MKTEALVEMLARGAGPAPRAVAARRLAPACVAGVGASLLLSWTLVGTLPAATFATAVPWMKLAYTGALVLAASLLAARAARPVPRMALPCGALCAVVLAMAACAAVAMAVFTPPGERWTALMGQTWITCPCLVLAVSLPALALSFWALRGLAPTRPRLAGLSAGLLAGSLGAVGYSLACSESTLAFVAVWYTLGVLLTGLAGAALGPRLLRW